MKDGYAKCNTNNHDTLTPTKFLYLMTGIQIFFPAGNNSIAYKDLNCLEHYLKLEILEKL